MTKKLLRSPNRCPAHPGKILHEIILPALDVSKAAIARALGVSRQTLYDLLNEEQAVTPEMAVRMSIVFGRSPESWLKMQNAHDLWHAQRKIDQKSLTPLHEVST